MVQLDRDGVPIIGANIKPNGYYYRFNGTKNPETDRYLKLDISGWKQYKEGGITFVRFVNNLNADPDGAGSSSVRLHQFTCTKNDEDNQRYTWKRGATENGFLTCAEDLKNAEWTLICRPNGIKKITDCIECKIGGGKHSGIAGKTDMASCFGVRWFYNASPKKSISFEFDHPMYEDHNQTALNTYKPLGDRWFGCKTVSYVKSEGGKKVRYIAAYFNEDPIDTKTGKPKQTGWKKYYEFTHTGNNTTTVNNKEGLKYRIPHSWGGAKSTWRCDQLTSLDVAYISHIQLDIGV